ncbi:MAG: thiol peroxidase [Gammaproteobacteria bacterium]|nr:thiol peroxidase [Gammaproteobacteria bacterium]
MLLGGEGSASFVTQARQKIIEEQISLDGLAARKKALAVVIADYEKQFNQIPQKSIELARLQRARLSSEKLYLLVEEKFNEAAKKKSNAVFLMISADLPFAMKRFCAAEGTSNVIPLAMMRSRNFAKDYGVLIQDGPLAGITARAVVVIDENNKVVYTQLVPEIAQEPDYDKALEVL